MCSDTVTWRSHRRIIADYLIVAGETVFHILGMHCVERARKTTAARVGASGILTYPGNG